MGRNILINKSFLILGILLPLLFPAYQSPAFVNVLMMKKPAACNTNDPGLVQYSLPNTAGAASAKSNYMAAQTAGNTNIAVVTWDTGTGTVSSISDSSGNTYSLAIGPTRSGSTTQYIYYASNIAAAAAGANAVTVNLSSSQAGIAIAIYEYRGLATSSALDGTPVSGTGTGTAAATSSLAVTHACDLLFSANYYGYSVVGIGAGYSVVNTPNADLIEHRVVSTTGSYTASSTQNPSGTYLVQLAAFKKVANLAVPTISQAQQYIGAFSSASVSYNYFLQAQTAGNTNIVTVSFNDATNTVTGITDSSGNTYTLAVGPTRSSSGTQYVYYAKNIAARAAGNMVTVNFNTSIAVGNVAIMEYRGLSANPFDVATGSSGTSTSPNSGSVVTNFANELVLGVLTQANPYVTSLGSGYSFAFASQTATGGNYPTVGQQKIVSSTGTYSSTATIALASDWIMQIVTFH